jgi:hypothetical protein
MQRQHAIVAQHLNSSGFQVGRNLQQNTIQQQPHTIVAFVPYQKHCSACSNPAQVLFTGCASNRQ